MVVGIGTVSHSYRFLSRAELTVVQDDILTTLIC
jgi:hypothetical protein